MFRRVRQLCVGVPSELKRQDSKGVRTTLLRDAAPRAAPDASNAPLASRGKCPRGHQHSPGVSRPSRRRSAIGRNLKLISI